MTIAEALDSLGTDPDEVACTLREGGFRGRPCIADHCPVSRYVRAKCGIPADLYVVAGTEGVSASGYVPAFTPSAVAAFITAFDDDGYPDLDDGTTAAVAVPAAPI